MQGTGWQDSFKADEFMEAWGFTCDITLLLGFVPPHTDITSLHECNFYKYVIYGNKSSGKAEVFNKLFFQKMSVCTWNANGLFCHNLVNFDSKIRIMRSICDRFDIVFFQETHDNLVSDVVQIYYKYFRTHILFCNPGTSSVGGTLIAIKLCFFSLFGAWKHRVVIKGRIQLLQLAGSNGCLDLLNIHSNPNLPIGDRINQIKGAWDLFRPMHHTLRFAGGDLNSCLCATDRVRIDNGQFCGIVTKLSEAILDLCQDFVNIDIGEYTHRHTGSNGKRTLAIIDRFLAGLPLEAYAIFCINAGVIGNAISKDNPSDHVPTFCIFNFKSKNSTFSIPHYIGASGVFSKFVSDRLSRNFEEDAIDCWEALEYYKFVLKEESSRVMNISRNRDAQTNDEKIYWSIKYLRSIHLNDWDQAKTCISAFSGIRSSGYISVLDILKILRSAMLDISCKNVLTRRMRTF